MSDLSSLLAQLRMFLLASNIGFDSFSIYFLLWRGTCFAEAIKPNVAGSKDGGLPLISKDCLSPIQYRCQYFPGLVYSCIVINVCTESFQD